MKNVSDVTDASDVATKQYVDDNGGGGGGTTEDTYVWSYNDYDAGAVVIPQPVVAAGDLVRAYIVCTTAPVDAETWAIYKNGVDTTEEIVLATTATSEADSTWAATQSFVAGDSISIDPESTPATASTGGSVVLVIART